MPSNIKIEIGAELRDSQGKLIKRFPWKRANSLLKQFVQCLAMQMSQAGVTFKAVDGANHSYGPQASAFRTYVGVRATGSSILIGTGTTPVTMTDYKLETQVSANITHPADTVAVENPDSSTWRVSIARVFTNNTGASLGIREVAIYWDEVSGVANVCLDRTLYSVDVPNGVGVTLTYRITISL